jgi:hypothetical protein
MMQTEIRRGLILALLGICGCGHRESRLLDDVQVKGIAPLGGDLAYVQSSGVVQRLNVTDNPQPKTTKVSIASNPRLIRKRPYDDPNNPLDELLIVSDGRSDQYGQLIDAPALTVLTDKGDKREYKLTDPGQQMQVSADGRFAILFNDPSYVDTNSLLTNPGEVAIVNLKTNDWSENPVIRNLDTVGGPPFAVWFLELNFGDQGIQPFALFAFPDGISLIDLTRPRDKGKKLELTSWLPSGGMDKSSGFGVVAGTNSAGVPEIYLKHNKSSDIKVLLVTPVTTTGDGGVGTVDISVRSLTASPSAAPGAFDIYSLGSNPRLLATLGNSVASVTTDSDTVTGIPLSIPANQILRFESTSPDDPTIRGRALLYQTDPAGVSLQSGVTFVDLDTLETSKTQALHSVDFGAKISSVLQLPKLSGQLLVILSGGGIDVLDLATRHWSPIESKVPITVMAPDTTGRQRLWVGGTGYNRIGYVDLTDDLKINKNTQLDNPVQQIFQMNKSVVVTHDQVGGAVTLVEAETPERSTAHKLEGFLLSDLL